jgi:hypothetical protein
LSKALCADLVEVSPVDRGIGQQKIGMVPANGSKQFTGSGIQVNDWDCICEPTKRQASAYSPSSLVSSVSLATGRDARV